MSARTEGTTGLRTFKVLAALLTYPEREMVACLDEMTAVLDDEAALPEPERRGVRGFAGRLKSADLMDAQAEYTALFDQSRSLSLHLFEHVHGESRERGGAMVDLLNLYRSRGLELSARELPDYLPLFLEFLSTQPEHEAKALLGDAVDVVGLIRSRLERRASCYEPVFRAIGALAPRRASEAAIRETVGAEAPDDTPEALDRSWAEAPVTFGNESAVPGGSRSCPAAAAVVDRFAPTPKRRS